MNSILTHIGLLNKMEARRELLKRQNDHDQYKSEQVQKIKEMKAIRFTAVDSLIKELSANEKYEQLVKYIQYLEHLNVGTWCDKCAAAMTVHSADADEFIKQMASSAPIPAPKMGDIEQLKSDVSSLKKLTQALNSRVSAIESTILAMQKSSYQIELITADGLLE